MPVNTDINYVWTRIKILVEIFDLLCSFEYFNEYMNISVRKKQ